MSEENLSTELANHPEQQKAIRRAFGTMAPFYDAWYTTPLGMYVWSVETVAMTMMLPQNVSGVILDIGTGTGMSLLLVQDSATQFVGVDIAWQMIEIAHQKTQHAAEMHLVLADGEKLPFRKSVVELAVGMTVLEFVPHPDELVREIHRCLVPSGGLVLGVLTSTNLWAMERRIRSTARPDVFRYAQFPSPWQIKRLLHQNGFTRVQYRGSVYAPTFTPRRWLASFSRIDEKLGNHWFWRLLGAFLVIRAQRG